jgi:hypothetical protein
MSRFTDSLQQKIKTSSAGLATFTLKVFSGFVLGLTIALIGEQALAYGNLSFIFVVLVGALVFLKLARSWNWVQVLVFDLVMVLIGLLLRMYILVAPGA